MGRQDRGRQVDTGLNAKEWSTNGTQVSCKKGGNRVKGKWTQTFERIRRNRGYVGHRVLSVGLVTGLATTVFVCSLFKKNMSEILRLVSLLGSGKSLTGPYGSSVLIKAERHWNCISNMRISVFVYLSTFITSPEYWAIVSYHAISHSMKQSWQLQQTGYTLRGSQ